MPTASDMAQLGSTLISGHRQRNVEIAAVKAGVGALRVETRQFVGHLHNQDLARRRDTQRHAAQTGRFVGQLHDQSQARSRDARQHAAETGDFVHNLHVGSLQRHNGAREHAAETGRFMGQLHNITRARRRDVRRHAAETVRFVRYLHGVTRGRKHEVGQLLGQARELMAGLGVISRDAQAEWRRQLVAIDSGRKTASAGRRASPRVGTAVAGAGSKARARRQESKPDVGNLVLAYVSGHPGTRLPQMEKALGINRIKAAKGVRSLLDQGTVRRDEETRQYFPV